MFGLPGTPALFYGEEIGLGEQLTLNGRMAVRTPMQWQPGPAGGFGSNDPNTICRPFPDGEYAPDVVNVAQQRHDPNSLLVFMRELIRRYRECPELAWGKVSVIEHDVAPVLALRSDWTTGSIVQLHNLSESPAKLELTLVGEPAGARLVDVFTPAAEGDVTLGDGGIASFALEGYDSRWMRLVRDGEPRLI